MVVVEKSGREHQKIPVNMVKSPLKTSTPFSNRIPIDRFHVSSLNVRFGEPFGKDEQDKNLIANLRAGKIVQPFKARPESDGYGVILGRRRFLAKKEAGAQFLTAGEDFIIQDMADLEAREASLIENLFHKDLNPVLRAKKLKLIITERGESLRTTARRWGIPASTLSEHISVLKLNPKMQDALATELLAYRDGVKIARMGLTTEQQDKLVEVLETRGKEAFKKLVEKVLMGHQLTKKPARNEKTKINAVGKVFWKELTKSLRTFASYWSDLCTVREWQDEEAYYLSLQVTAPKHSDEPTEEEKSIENYDGLEILSREEAPQLCGLCGKDILEGDPFSESNGFYYCRECTNGGLH